MSAPGLQFWYRWLVVVTVGLALFSLSFIMLPDVIQAFFNWLVASTLDVPRSADANGLHHLRFVYGVMGAVMLGWSILLLSTLVTGFRAGVKSAWWGLTLSIVAWFVLDTGFSLSMGFPQNALFNVLFFILYAVPLIATYPKFFPNVARANVVEKRA